MSHFGNPLEKACQQEKRLKAGKRFNGGELCLQRHGYYFETFHI
jgi:hypothetical protein